MAMCEAGSRKCVLGNVHLRKIGASVKEVGVRRKLTYEGVFFKFDMGRNEKPLLVARGTCNKITDTLFTCKQEILHLAMLLYLTSKSARHCGSSTTSVPTIKSCIPHSLRSLKLYLIYSKIQILYSTNCFIFRGTRIKLLGIIYCRNLKFVN